MENEELEISDVVLSTVEDLCQDFLYYDRKSDEELSYDRLRKAVESGEITINEMVEEFRRGLEESFNY